MNRRTSIKRLLLFGAVGVSSFSVYEWFNFNKSININTFYTYKYLIAELAETIIPRTSTPGAKDAKVEEYIIKILGYCTEPRTQHKFLTGLTDLENYSSNKYGHSFVKCGKGEKASILNHFEEKSKYPVNVLNKINNKFIGKPFFVKLKELTVEGYCMSEPGATQGLAYDFIPSTYQSCIPLQPNQRSWATK